MWIFSSWKFSVKIGKKNCKNEAKKFLQTWKLHFWIIHEKFLPSSHILNGAFSSSFSACSFFSVCFEKRREYEKKSMRKIRCIRENSLAKEEKLFYCKNSLPSTLTLHRHILITSCLANIYKKVKISTRMSNFRLLHRGHFERCLLCNERNKIFILWDENCLEY